MLFYTDHLGPDLLTALDGEDPDTEVTNKAAAETPGVDTSSPKRTMVDSLALSSLAELAGGPAPEGRNTGWMKIQAV